MAGNAPCESYYGEIIDAKISLYTGEFGCNECPENNYDIVVPLNFITNIDNPNDLISEDEFGYYTSSIGDICVMDVNYWEGTYDLTNLPCATSEVLSGMAIQFRLYGIRYMSINSVGSCDFVTTDVWYLVVAGGSTLNYAANPNDICFRERQIGDVMSCPEISWDFPGCESYWAYNGIDFPGLCSQEEYQLRLEQVYIQPHTP